MKKKLRCRINDAWRFIKSPLVFLVLLLALLIGCEQQALKEKPAPNSFSYSKDQISLDYVGNVSKEGILNLSLKVQNKERTLVLDGLDIDVTSKGYRLKVSQVLKKKTTELLLSNFTKEDAAIVDDALFGLINEIKAEKGATEFRKEEMEGLFYYSAVFKAIQRYHIKVESKNGRELAECLAQARQQYVEEGCVEMTPYNGYITDLTPYYATEDIVIDSYDFQAYVGGLTGTRLTINDVSYIGDRLSNYRSNYGIPTITLRDYIDVVHVPVLAPAPDRCILLCGTDCGCCGNYEGQCYYARWECYVHDYLCQRCTPRWFCFSGCQATPC